MIKSLDKPKGIYPLQVIATFAEYKHFRFAYIEFTTKEAVECALMLDDSLFKGRQLKVDCYFFNIYIR